MSNEQKLCKDCKHYLFAMHPPHHFCKNAMLAIDPVTGAAEFASAAKERQGRCGAEGRLFEKKPPGFWARVFGNE